MPPSEGFSKKKEEQRKMYAFTIKGFDPHTCLGKVRQIRVDHTGFYILDFSWREGHYISSIINLFYVSIVTELLRQPYDIWIDLKLIRLQITAIVQL